ncbi:MAG: histidine ammonia-lyase [Reichenbachiella sp.]
MRDFAFGVDHMTVSIALSIAQGKTIGIFSKKSIQQINKSSQSIDSIVARGETLYGVNTGFGPLCTTKISKEETQILQVNILKSHSAGMGNPVSIDVAKLMMILKLHALSFGYSGIRLETLERIKWMLDHNIIPVVPELGSVGASGDLAPLAHLFLPLIGLGEVSYKNKVVPTEEVFVKEKLSPIELGPKEGLALINGTQFICAHAIIAVDKLHNCLENADIIGAMSLESQLGSVKPFQEALHKIRPHKGAQYVANRMRHLLKGSEMVESHMNCDRVQDPYSLRCIPQVHGSSRNAWLHLKEATEIEINSVTDNPIVLDADNTVSGGNFHGQPLALPLDYACFAASEIGNISDRRTYLLLEGKNGLPELLMKNTGVNSGFMLAQYTTAALVTENKTLCFPASADSIPTSLGQEDHVSMGSISGRKLISIINNLEKILAIELTCAAQAFDYRRPLKSSPFLEKCHEIIRKKINHAEEDRVFSKDLQSALEIIESQSLTKVSYKKSKKENIPLNGEYDELFRLY